MDPQYKTQARVIVTRPVAQSDRLSALINDAGGSAIRIPALEISSTDNPEVAKEVFARIEDFSKVLFISPNAVRHSLQFFNVDALKNLECLAIGASTAQAMTQAGIDCKAFPKNNFTSEALLELPELQSVENQNILIVRGNGGRALLGNELAKRGANIDYVEVYQRRVPKKSAVELQQLLANGSADVVIANSAETLANLVGMAGDEQKHALFELQLVTGSARVAQAANVAGFVKNPQVADAPDDHALMRAIVSVSNDTSDETPVEKQTDDSGEEATAGSSADIAESSSVDVEESTDSPSATDGTREHTRIHDTATLEEAAPDALPQHDEHKETIMSDTPKDEQTHSDNDDAMYARPEDISDVENVENNDTGPSEPTPAPPPATVVKRGGAGVAWLALLTALLAAAGTAWNWWQSDKSAPAQEAFDVASLNIPSRDEINNQIREASQSQSGRVTQQLDRYDGTLRSLEDEQSDLASQVRSQKRSVENLTEELTQMSDSISAMRGVSASVRNTWVRAETEYFLQTANTRLQLAGDIKSATQALKAADERIVALGDPSLTPVRAQLSEDLLALESLPQIDIEGIALSINSLAGRVTNLPLRNQAASTFASDAAPNVANEDDGAWSKVKTALSDTVGGFVRVSPTEDAGAALLAPEQAYFLFRNLELQLQAARIAALQSKQATYDNSLASSKAWIEQYFDLEDSGVETVLARIVDLQSKQVSLELPDISRSLNLIRAIVPATRSSGPGTQSATPVAPTDATRQSIENQEPAS